MPNLVATPTRRTCVAGLTTLTIHFAIGAGCAIMPDTLVRGIDISVDNGTIDWRAVARSGVQFAYIKASEGRGYTDLKYVANIRAARRAGLVVGSYHVFTPDDDGQAQAEHFIDTASIELGDLPPILDLESLPVSITAGVFVHRVSAWLDTVAEDLTAKLGTKNLPGLYLRSDVWVGLGEPAWSRYPLWLAEWEIAAPRGPAVWPNYTFWQYSDSGTVPGISGPVDMSRGSDLVQSSRL